MLVLGISSRPDSSGWALVDVNAERARLISTGRVHSSSGEVVASLAGQLSNLSAPPELVVVEDAKPSERAYSQTVGRWLQAFEAVGMECATVAPPVWQAAMAGGDDPDRNAIGPRAAGAIFGPAVAEGAAACVALWAGRKRSR